MKFFVSYRFEGLLTMMWSEFLRFKRFWTFLVSKLTLSTALESCSWTKGLSRVLAKALRTLVKSVNAASLIPFDSVPLAARYCSVWFPGKSVGKSVGKFRKNPFEIAPNECVSFLFGCWENWWENEGKSKWKFVSSMCLFDCFKFYWTLNFLGNQTSHLSILCNLILILQIVGTSRSFQKKRVAGVAGVAATMAVSDSEDSYSSSNHRRSKSNNSHNSNKFQSFSPSTPPPTSVNYRTAKRRKGIPHRAPMGGLVLEY